MISLSLCQCYYVFKLDNERVFVKRNISPQKADLNRLMKIWRDIFKITKVEFIEYFSIVFQYQNDENGFIKAF